MSKRIPLLLVLLACGLTACERPPKNLPDPDAPQKVMPPELEAQCNRLYRLNMRGRRISWKGAVPVLFTLDTSFPQDFVSAMESAINSWNLAAGAELLKLNGYRRDRSTPALDRQNTIYYLRSDDPNAEMLRVKTKHLLDDENSIAATQLFVRANKILDVDIVFDGITRTFTMSRFHVNSFDVESIALHELGHALGLIHNNDNPMSIMFFGNSSFSIATRTIDSLSRQMLTCEY